MRSEKVVDAIFLLIYHKMNMLIFLLITDDDN